MLQTVMQVSERVAHHLVLDLLPALEVLLDQHLADGTGGEARLGDAGQLGAGSGDAASGSAESEGGTDDYR